MEDAITTALELLDDLEPVLASAAAFVSGLMLEILLIAGLDAQASGAATRAAPLVVAILAGFVLRSALRRGLSRAGRLLRSLGLPKPFDLPSAFAIDGDTLAAGDLRIRIWGIDAPERGQPQGLAARDHIVDLMGRRELRVDPVDRDRYGRLVARVVARDGQGCVDLGERMVQDGYALACRAFTRAYVRAERRARRARKGLWKRGRIADPLAYRRANA